jgi:t-SNARE complex subunit (syntaxin)
MSKKVKTMNELDEKATAELESASPAAGASVDKIRDILFGSQIKNYEARFARLEENLVRETVELKETMRRRFESLEGFFRSETEALAARLKAEREERTNNFHSLDRDLKAAHDELGRKIHELDAATAEAQSGLRKELMAESRKLLDEISERHDNLRSLLERRVGELRHQKADRSLLSALLTGMAAQIAEDSESAHDGNEGH